MQMKFKNLMLEVTRRCNMQCNHCMRGDAENADMYTDVIRKVFESAKEIRHLGLTGGEPSLCPYVIEYISYYARINYCRIGSFFCATNAKEYSADFVKALNELYGQCTDKDNCILTISIDQFHSEADPKALEEYRKLPYYKPIKEKGFIHKGDILSEGRAEQNGLGRFSLPHSEKFYELAINGFYLDVGDRVYINAFGDVLANADMSYEKQVHCGLGNIINRPMDEILLSAMYKIPEHWWSEEKSVYSIRIRAEANTISAEALEDQTYYATAPLAAAAYHSLKNNLRITPMDPKERRIPDDLHLQYEDMDPDGLRCDGCIITYVLPHSDSNNKVMIEVIRCPVEEDFDDVRE